MQFLKKTGLLSFCILWMMSAQAQVNDPCKGDIIGKKAGGTPYAIPKNCDVIIMSLMTYDSLRLQEKKLEKEIGLLDEQIVLTKRGMALRDSVIQEKDGIIRTQDEAIKEYRQVAEDAIKAGEASTKNTERCLEELEKQRFRTKFFAILGAAAGFVAGLVTGIFIAG